MHFHIEYSQLPHEVHLTCIHFHPFSRRGNSRSETCAAKTALTPSRSSLLCCFSQQWSLLSITAVKMQPFTGHLLRVHQWYRAFTCKMLFNPLGCHVWWVNKFSWPHLIVTKLRHKLNLCHTIKWASNRPRFESKFAPKGNGLFLSFYFLQLPLFYIYSQPM